MSRKVILNSQCFPKKDFHCGNAVSHIISEIIYLYLSNYDKDNDYWFVFDSWNLHGLPFEELYEKEVREKLEYNKVKDFVKPFIADAKREKSIFSTINRDSHLIQHSDTDDDFVEFTIQTIYDLLDSKIIVKRNSQLSFDISSVNDVNYLHINIVPRRHQISISNDSKMINGCYDVTKERKFSPSITIEGNKYVINPIFQSLIYPLYICEKYNFDYPSHLFISSSGHGMLKWHYLRNIVSHALTKKPPYENLVLHGNILGRDHKRMSKHSNNVVKPSDLFKIIGDKRFIRHVLIKSISDNDIALQTDISFSEFNKIRHKLDLIQTGKFSVLNFQSLSSILVSIKNDLQLFKIKKSFDSYYNLIRKIDIIPSDKPALREFYEIRLLNYIYYGSNHFD